MRYLFLSLLFICCLPIASQSPSDLRSEQVFLRPMAYSCAAGDSIDVDGVVTCIAKDRMRPYGRYVYLETIDGDSVISRQKVVCDNDGYFRARMATDTDPKARIGYLRAYTNLMRDFSAESFAIQPILINSNFPKRCSPTADAVRLIAIPSGGVLVPSNSFMQGVTALLTDTNGYPLSGIAVDLVNDKGTVVYNAVTSKSGQALLWLMPNVGDTYSVNCVVNGERVTSPLADVSKSAIKLTAMMVKNTVKYDILNVSCLDGLSLYTYDRFNGLCKAGVVNAQGS